MIATTTTQRWMGKHLLIEMDICSLLSQTQHTCEVDFISDTTLNPPSLKTHLAKCLTQYKFWGLSPWA